MTNEFTLIHRYFAPLAGEGALSLTDDAALITPAPRHQLVVTKDALVEGVHFTGQESPADIAKKALRVNLSDLASMGAAPLGYLLALVLPRTLEADSFLEEFTDGLADDQAIYHLSLLGGDTVTTPDNRLTLSITAFGQVRTGKALTRSGAQPGDYIYVTGTLGDAAAGLPLYQQGEQNSLTDRYLLPQPRLAFGQALIDIATACADISDGLAADLGHICETSNVGAILEADAVPLSDAFRETITDKDERYRLSLSGGDDFELVFTAPPSQHNHIQRLSAEHHLQCTRIGEIMEGDNVVIQDAHGHPIHLATTGYRHC